ncbi:MAG: CopD family protein [Zoogloeaceae bacterium]|nr:CopD family protein [Zoogloeaceae bacterium]MCP5254101.1 CopD family protein [Zoogloeaceae bacterium]MCW5613663.1 CopD family protein [Rhodocyclaceae bacterium]
MRLHHLMLFLHLLGVIVWVGGMAFAWACLRPAAGALAPPERLALWVAVLKRFFAMVWVSVALVASSGLTMLVATGFARAPLAWHAMLVSGSLMIAVFVSIWFGPWPALCAAQAGQDWAKGAAALGRIRQRVALNLLLASITLAVATLGLAFQS